MIIVVINITTTTIIIIITITFHRSLIGRIRENDLKI
jgi:hypothetical protein